MIRIIILTAVTLSFSCGLWKVARRPVSLKIFCAFLGLTALSEISAWIMVKLYHNNMAVFHIFSPILFLILALYFNQVSVTVRKYYLGYWFAGIGLCASIVNTAFFQPILSLNSNYLLLEGLFVCVLGFITLYDIEKDDTDFDTNKNPHFWIAVIVLFQHVGTYFIYILLQFLELSHTNAANIELAYSALWMTGVVAYLSIGMVYLLFPIQKKAYE